MNPSAIPVQFPDTPVGEDALIKSVIDVLCFRCHETAVCKKWWDDERNNGELLMLIVSELAEGLEGLRHNNPPSDHIPEFSAIEEELADACVRIFDMCAARGYRLGEALIAKMAYNTTRPVKHGGKAF